MGEKILQKIKDILARILEWWKSFSSKQRTLIVVLAVVVVLAFVGMYALITSPNYTLLKQCASTKETSEITSILDNANIKYKVTDDGLMVKIPKKDLSVANVALGANGITSNAYTLDAALSSSFTTTEADKQKKYKLYLESQLENDLLPCFSAIKTAKVELNIPTNDGTLLATKEQPGAWIVLEIDGEFTSDNAAYVAKAVATALGCDNTDNIVIMDMEANLLFSGSNDSTISGNASSQLAVKADAEALMNSDVKKVLQGTGVFGDVKVSTNLIIDFSSTEKTSHSYTPAEGSSQGVLGEEKSYTSESTGTNGGTPGTDSNTETTYYYQDNSYSSSTIEELYRKYLPNEAIESTTIPPGTIKYSESSVGISSTNFIVIKEDDVKKRGELDGITWEEYQASHSERKQLEVSEDMISLVASTTGIPQDKISIMAYEENVFIDSEGLGVDISNILQIVIIVIILGLLAFVVIRSMKTEKEPEEAEELSVETLLQSTPEPTVEDIGVEEISETRRMIEKFVEENPEAVANLLRNWLTEEW